jgi:Uma2 family endonuclease
MEVAMSTASPNKLMTVEEFLALPDDPTVERMLIKGELWEWEVDGDMTKRNKKHSSTESMVAHRLLDWLETQPEPRGTVASGEAGCILLRDPDSSVGIDAAYFSSEVAQRESGDSTLFEGPPILAVEILSPSMNYESIEAKIRDYLDAGVKLVWVVDPGFKTATVYRPDDNPRMFSGDDQITGGAHLPGFSVPVSKLFQL